MLRVRHERSSPPPPRTRALSPPPPPSPAPAQTFFANERTFLAWLHMAVTIGSIATAMLSVAGGGGGGSGSGGGESLVPFIAMVLLPVAILVCGYGEWAGPGARGGGGRGVEGRWAGAPTPATPRAAPL